MPTAQVTSCVEDIRQTSSIKVARVELWSAAHPLSVSVEMQTLLQLLKIA